MEELLSAFITALVIVGSIGLIATVMVLLIDHTPFWLQMVILGVVLTGLITCQIYYKL